MVKKLFWDDPHLAECEARVIEVDGDKIKLDQTIAYAFSGGQESDTGTIGGFEILDAKKVGLDIVYTLKDHNLQEQDQVKVVIDANRRYRMMRLHFSGDLVLQIILKEYPDLKRIGAHVSEDKARIDFVMETKISSMFEWIQAEVQRVVAADYPITTAFSDEAGQVRYWEIEGYPATNCGGTHVKSTKEIGEIKLKRKNIGGGKERIEISLVEN